MRSFGYKIGWLAVRSDDGAAVAEAAQLADVAPVDWADGLERVYAGDDPGAVLVTPPVDGWTLVVFDPAHDEDEFADLAALSARFGEAQRFGSHRVVDLHAWARWIDGHPSRRFQYLGETGEVQVDEGEVTEAEEPEDLEMPDEETVMAIAGDWSVDPTTLDDREDLSGDALLGRTAGGASQPDPEPEGRRRWWQRRR